MNMFFKAPRNQNPKGIKSENIVKKLENKILSGQACKNKVFADGVLEAFAKICIQIFPALNTPKINDNFSHVLALYYGTDLDKAFQKSLLDDSEISQIFSNANSDATQPYHVYTSSKAGGQMPIETFSLLLLEKAYILMRIKNNFSIDGLLLAAENVLEMMRAAIKREVFGTPLLIYFEGAGFQGEINIETFNGTIESLHDGINDIFPSNIIPPNSAGFIFRGNLNYEMAILKDNTFDLAKNWPTKTHDHAKIKDICDNISFAMAMASGEGKEVISTLELATLTFDPFLWGANVSWRGLPYNTSALRDLEGDVLSNLKIWLDVLSNNNDENIFLAKRRLLSALINRFDPQDSFLDLMIALENLFSVKGEAAFSISTCVSRALSSDYEQREIIFRDIKNLYNQRSRIVHGLGKGKLPDHNEMIKLKEKTLVYVMDCLKWLYLKNPELLGMDSGERARRIALS